MKQNVYVLSTPGTSQPKPLYIRENGHPTTNLGDAKTFSSKFWLILHRIIYKGNKWDIMKYSKKSIFEARLKGK